MLDRLLKIAILVIVLIPQALFAGEVNVDTHTYYSQREDELGSTAKDIGTLYEYISLDISVDNLSFVFAGWGKAEMMDIRIGYPNDDRYDGDFSAAYIDYLHESTSLHFRLGKQAVLGHGSYESLSGAFIETAMAHKSLNLTLSGYYGAPEELEERSSSGDSLSGGRATLGMTGKWELGYSYLKELDDSDDFREEEQVSVWLMPFSKLELYGETVFNNIAKENARSSVEGNLYATSKITLSGKYEKIDYEGYFEKPEIYAFNLFTTYDELEISSGVLAFDLSSKISLKLEAKEYSFEKAKEKAQSYGGGIKLSTDSVISELSYHKTDSDDVTKGYYDEYRFYVMRRTDEGLTLSCDGILDQFEKKIGGEDSSVTVIASAGYKFNEDFSISVDLDYSNTPQYEEDYKVFARVEYSFGKQFQTEPAADVKAEEATYEKSEEADESEKETTDEEPDVDETEEDAGANE
jgi:hypothetical protein